MKILQIAYHYPPMGGAAVQRALKFSKFLPGFGIEPVVLAAHDPDYVADASLAEEIPAGVAVHRIEHRPWLQRALAWRARLAPRAAAERGTGNDAGDGARLSAVVPGSRRAGPWLGAARDALLRTMAAVQYPDDKGAWARKALTEGSRLVRAHGIELIFSSSPPASAHWLGARLAREFNLPWVADLRDLWTDNPGYAAPAWRRALDRRTETAWLRQAAGVVTVTPSWQRMLAQRVAGACPVVCIPNGFDEDDFAAAEAATTLAAPQRDDAFCLVHTGTFYGPRDPAALLDGLALYLQTAAAPRRPLKVKLIGNMGARFEARLAQFDLRHPGVVERRAYLPHRDALAELRAADALLLVVGGASQGGSAAPNAAVSGWLPGKIFEYLRAAKPVLLLGPEQGDAADLVRRHSGGWVVDESRPERIAQALDAMVNGPTLTLPARVDGLGVQAFERRRLAGELATFLRSVQASP